MQKQENKSVLAVVNDLFFSVEISDAAKRVGMPVEFVKNEEVIAKAKSKPALIILDLNFDQVQPLKLISELKSGAEFKGDQPDRLPVAHSGRLEAESAGGGLRYGYGAALGVLAESAADPEATLGEV